MALPPSEIKYKPVHILPVPNYMEDQRFKENNNEHQPENIQKQSNSMYNLLDFDLKILLLNYNDLESIEKERLIEYLRKLEKQEPERLENLSQYIDASVPFKFNNISNDAKTKLTYNSNDNQNHILSKLTNEVMGEEILTPDNISIKNTVTDKSKVVTPEKRINSVDNTSIPISFEKYGSILEVGSEDIMIPPRFKSGTIPKTELDYNSDISVYNHETDSPPKRHAKLRENIKYLFDWDKITVPIIPYKRLRNLVKCYDELCINEKTILIDYISKLKEQSPFKFMSLCDFLKTNYPENHILKKQVFSGISENDSLETILNESIDLILNETPKNNINFESNEEYTLDDIVQIAVKNFLNIRKTIKK